MRRVINGNVEGFVVRGKAADMYLGYNLKWFRHRTPEEAYVHSREVVVAGGEWTSLVQSVVPAKYYSAGDVTQTTGNPIPYPMFLAQLVEQEYAPAQVERV